MYLELVKFQIPGVCMHKLLIPSQNLYQVADNVLLFPRVHYANANIYLSLQWGIKQGKVLLLFPEQ